MSKEIGVRSNKLKLIYKKAIQMILANKVGLLRILEENTPVDSFFNSDASKSVIGREESNSTLEQKLLDLKNQLGDLFKSKVDEYDLISKLNEFDFVISNNLSTSADLNDPLFVKEVYESNLVEQKVLFGEFVGAKISKNQELEEEAKEELRMLREEIEHLGRRNKEKANKVDSLTNKIYSVLEQ